MNSSSEGPRRNTHGSRSILLRELRELEWPSALRKTIRQRASLFWCCLILSAGAFPTEAALPMFDFTQKSGAQGWQAAHDMSPLKSTQDGLLINITGGDPYLIGPARDFPAGQTLWGILRLKSEQPGTAQLFYFRDNPSEANSVRFPVPAGDWYEARFPLPPLGPGYRMRIDPPGIRGICVLSSLRFEARVHLTPPKWPVPMAPQIAPDDAIEVRSGDLVLRHARNGIGAFEIDVAGRSVAFGNSTSLVGYQLGPELHWMNLSQAPDAPVVRQDAQPGLLATAIQTDPDGATWTFQQRFTPGPKSGMIQVQIEVRVSQDRDVVYLPALTLLPGLNSFGTNKTQAVFAGVEYLENEPSSSEADLIGPAARRQVPDTIKETLPLMALAAEGRCLSLIWEQSPDFCAVFDSPDRLFGSKGHVMGLIFPGSNGANREDGNLLPYRGNRMLANEPIVARAVIAGDLGSTVVPALQRYVDLRGLPPLPDIGYSAEEYYQLGAAGWLDSKIREGNLFRHAFWSGAGFGPQPAADAALFMEWLEGKTTDANLKSKLRAGSAQALAQIPPNNYNFAGVGHVRFPVESLVYGAVRDNAAHARDAGQSLLGQFRPDGSVLYAPAPGGIDYGKTHFSRDANGYTARIVLSLLEYAVASGDTNLIRSGLQRLDGLLKFRNTVPRGAQTWEIPLHTPDILASALLIRAFTIGYELTGKTAYLEQAQYWAWTGVPFIYLQPPTRNPVGLYSTIPVLGATQWHAPVWIGLPVQWCGLVYADALYRFARHDARGPWRKIADGITASGIQQTWGLDDAQNQGLLPDSFQLNAQLRNGPAINPGTVMSCAVRLISGADLYDVRCLPERGWIIQAPGDIHEFQSNERSVEFRVAGWPSRPWRVLITGIRNKPVVRINGQEVRLGAPHQYLAAEHQLILLLWQPDPLIEITGD